MKTSVIYSGQARTFARVFENQYFHCLRFLPDPEFFVSVARDEQCGDMHRLLERFPKEKVHIEYVMQPELPEPPPDPPYRAMYGPSSSPQAILRQLWALNRAWEFASELGANEADIVVRIRPDIAFYRFEMPQTVGNAYSGVGIWHDWRCETPYWARWGGVNDRLALLGREVAPHYFGTHHLIDRHCKQGCPLHPETLVYQTLKLAGIRPSHTLATEFATIRLDGTRVEPSVSLVDQMEYARTRP